MLGKLWGPGFTHNPSLKVIDQMTRHKAGLKPCSYNPGPSPFRSCRPLGLPAKGN